MNENTPTHPVQTTGPEVQENQVSIAQPTTEEVPIPVETVKSEQSAGAERTQASFLYRHPDEKKIGGICGGLGDKFNIDPILVRIMWIVLTLGTAGAGLFAYIAVWLLLPVGTAQAGQHAPAALELNERNVERAGLLLIICGFLWWMANIGILPALWSVFWRVMGLGFWPVLLVGAAFLMLQKQRAWRSRFASARYKMQSRKTRAKSSLGRESAKASLCRSRSSISLRRSREERLVFGVCGGIGKAIGLDANLVRLFWVASAIGSVGIGVLVYVLIGWLLPEDEQSLEPNAIQEPQDATVIDGTVG